MHTAQTNTNNGNEHPHEAGVSDPLVVVDCCRIALLVEAVWVDFRQHTAVVMFGQSADALKYT